METDATRMYALLVGLPDVAVSGVGDWPLWLRVVVSVDPERTDDHEMVGPYRRVAPVACIERADRSREQPGEASQASRVRARELPTSPSSLPALRRPTRLDPSTHDPTPKREEPEYSEALVPSSAVLVGNCGHL